MNNGEKAVGYMRKMATGCHWRVSREIHYVKTDGSEFVLRPGLWYTGVPYTQGKKKRLHNLFRFKLNLFGGFLFLKKSLVGCDCSSAASFAWRKMNPGLPILSTRKMYVDLCGAQRYVTHRGMYGLRGNETSSREIIRQNVEQSENSMLYDAYSALSTGDGLLQYDRIERKGHIMIVTCPLQDSRILIIDQKGFGEGGSEQEDTSWRVDFMYTLEQLMEEGYLPVFLRN